MLVLKIRTGSQTPTFESATLVGGFNPQNPQRFRGSVAEFKCSLKAWWGIRAKPTLTLGFLKRFVGERSKTNTQEAAPKGSMGILRRLAGRRRRPRGEPGGSKQKRMGTLLVSLNVDL